VVMVGLVLGVGGCSDGGDQKLSTQGTTSPADSVSVPVTEGRLPQPGKSDFHSPATSTNGTHPNVIATSAEHQGDGVPLGLAELVAVAVSLSLLLCLAAVVGLLRWRRIVSGGMMAVTPVTLLDSLAELQKKPLEAFDSRVGEAHQRIVQGLLSLDDGQQRHQESVKLLDAQLCKKDQLIEMLSKMLESEHRDGYIHKVCKLLSFIAKLRKQVSEGKVSGIEAVDFLREELQELLLESGAKVFSPVIGTKYSGLDKDLVEIVNSMDIRGSDFDSAVVSAVGEPAIYLPQAAGSERLVYRKAVVELRINGG
jgi:hypothetical protein